VASTRGFALVAGGYPLTNGSVISGVVSSFDTTKYGLDYVVPVGENSFVALGSPLGTSNSMATASLIISAADDGTVVNIDKDANGTFDQTATINQGEVVMANTGVMQGAHVVRAPAQVHLSTGDPYGLRIAWFSLFPTHCWSDYMSPVGSSIDNSHDPLRPQPGIDDHHGNADAWLRRHADGLAAPDPELRHPGEPGSSPAEQRR
jgi:hypothetical protein